MGDSQESRQQANYVPKDDIPSRLAEDEFYDAMAVSQRRRLLYYLLAEGESSVEELTTVLSGWEATTTGSMQTSAEWSDLRLTLVHNHLPRLTAAGLVTHDPDNDTVEIASLHPRVVTIIRQSVEAEEDSDT
jgi:DNA-binding transcriptional ArsR family regulator